MTTSEAVASRTGRISTFSTSTPPLDVHLPQGPRHRPHHPRPKPGAFRSQSSSCSLHRPLFPFPLPEFPFSLVSHFLHSIQTAFAIPNGHLKPVQSWRVFRWLRIS
ncbi:hypothetical protein CCUS01_03376 [Colletotrichum cuscutae]|uniref:Uncharacterized protein n=1 Tax=Colletotrichum cuscutae TaxID=1209917 RepID=A0AAI9Y8D6_9PEZI|nr:hypothetical protein CCUS01_03376 [Colletotrichum cuscutae]